MWGEPFLSLSTGEYTGSAASVLNSTCGMASFSYCCLLAGTIDPGVFGPRRYGFSLDPEVCIDRTNKLLVYWNVSGAGHSSAFHETGYACGVEIGVIVPLDRSLLSSQWPRRFPPIPRQPPWFARPHSRLALFCDDLQRAPTLSDTTHHTRRCLDMPLPENTTISLHGHTRPEDTLHSKPKQAFFLRLSTDTLEALQASPLPQVQFTFGKRSVGSILTARSPQLDLLPCRVFKWETRSSLQSQVPKMQFMIYISVPLQRGRRTHHSNTTQRWLESSWYSATALMR